MPAAATAARMYIRILETPFDFDAVARKRDVLAMPRHVIDADQIQPFLKLIARVDELIE
jgi:hypothetical protein